MSWTARGGFFILLFGAQVVRGLEAGSWGGTYPWKKVCALTGATVDLRCFFTYPPTINGQDVSVEKTLWFTEEGDRQPEDLRSDPQYAGRLHGDCHGNWCTLSIAELRASDSGVYKFRFVTNRPSGGSYTVTPGVSLTVTDLSVQWRAPDEQSLSCVSKCSLGSSTSYIWFENGEEVPDENVKVYTPTSGSKNSYSCAIKGHRQLVSPPMCVSRSCNKVHYHKRSICALKGSSVDLNCTYSSYDELRSKFWYRPDHKHVWADASVPQDLRLEEQYHARVEFPPAFDGRSTLRIQNVTESDSAEYRFKFTARDFEWMNNLPGTNLTVTAATVRVNAVKVEDSHTVARLSCHTGCRPSADLSFCWRRNGDPLARCSPLHAAKHLELSLNPGDYVTCDVEGHPLSSSPRLYALRAPSVSPSDSGDILEGAPLNLTCSSDSSSAEHRWYKQIRPSRRQILTSGPVLVFRSIKSSDSAEYFCTVGNELGKKTSEPVAIDVKYAPRFSSLRVSPSNIADEGQSVNLTCNSDANPAASYILYKDNHVVLQGPERHYRLISIRTRDAGSFYCKAQNKYGHVDSSPVFLDVQATSATLRTNVIRLSVTLVLLILVILLALCMRKKTSPSSRMQPNELRQPEGRPHGDYENIYASVPTHKRQQEDTL